MNERFINMKSLELSSLGRTKMDKNYKLGIVLGTLALLSAIFLYGVYVDYPPTVSAVTESSTVSNATVAVTIGFTFSGNLSNGILFGEVNTNTNDNNATGNYLADAGNSSYFILMDTANNADADTCLNDNVALTSGANTIPNTGYTIDANSTIDGGNMNNPASSVAITTSYASFGTEALSADDSQYFQFYLDVPAGQAAGVYNNTVNFKIIQNGVGSC